MNSTGANASAAGDQAVAVGPDTTASADYSVALGAGSIADTAYTVSVGSSVSTRKIVNVSDGTVASGSTDAVNGGQLYSYVSSTVGGAAIDCIGAAGRDGAVGDVDDLALVAGEPTEIVFAGSATEFAPSATELSAGRAGAVTRSPRCRRGPHWWRNRRC